MNIVEPTSLPKEKMRIVCYEILYPENDLVLKDLFAQDGAIRLEVVIYKALTTKDDAWNMSGPSKRQMKHAG
jgi:hypothetical protein